MQLILEINDRIERRMPVTFSRTAFNAHYFNIRQCELKAAVIRFNMENYITIDCNESSKVYILAASKLCAADISYKESIDFENKIKEARKYSKKC